MLQLKSFILSILSFVFVPAQSQSAYNFWKDDTVLRNKFLQESIQKKQSVLAAAPKQYAKDYKEIYHAINLLLKGSIQKKDFATRERIGFKTKSAK